MMQATDLRLTFNPGTPIENPALRGIDLNIADGEFVTVIGTNGAGKSTFLNAKKTWPWPINAAASVV